MPTLYRGSEKERRALGAYVNLVRCTSALNEFVHRHLTAHNLTERQFAVLEALYHLGPADQTTLCAKLLTSGGNLTLVIDNLVKRHLAVRTVDPADRRRRIVMLTSRGRTCMGKLFPVHAAGILAAMEALSSRDQERLRKLCRTLGLAAAGND